MKPNAAATRAVAHDRPNRLLVALAALWIAGSLAIGGAVSGTSGADASAPTTITRTASQP
jgi:hypothetical protein